jgi:hypothetical protein
MTARELPTKWRKQAADCMRMAGRHQLEALNISLGMKEGDQHENDRYRWRRVAETFRFCAKELRRAIR